MHFLAFPVYPFAKLLISSLEGLKVNQIQYFFNDIFFVLCIINNLINFFCQCRSIKFAELYPFSEVSEIKHFLKILK